MSADDGGPAGREVAYRLFAAEFDDADFGYSESDEERAPNYVVTPTGARVNRLFVVGVLTSVERVGDDVLRARVADPTGAFVVYAGQYQPDAAAFLEDAATPSFVAVGGKARTFEPEDGDRVFTSIRPESVSEVDAATRDRWVVRTAEHTLDRVATVADAIDRPERGGDLRDALVADGVPEGLADGTPRALDHYGTTPAYLAAVRDLALDAVRVVTGDRDSVGELELAPDDGGDVEGDLEVGGRGAAAIAGTADAGGSTAEATATEPSEGEAATPDERATEDAPDASEADPAPDESEAAEAEPEEAADEVYDLDEDEREAVLEEHDVSFASGSEIPDAGETDIETPDDGELDEETPDDDEPAAESASDDDSEPADLEDTVVAYMEDLGGGDGVARDALVDAVTSDHDVTDAEVADAVQDALMAGRCYESGEDELTPI